MRRFASTPGRAFPAVAVVLALGISSVPARAQDPNVSPCAATSNDPGFAQITVDLNAGTTSGGLPFDVPVRACGQAATGTQTVTLQYLGDKNNPPQVDENCHATSGTWEPATPLRTRPSGTTFRLVVPRLEAQRYYAFCFREEAEVTVEQANAFRRAARKVLDDGLAQTSRADFDEAQSCTLRKQLCNALKQELSADTAIKRGSMFDCESLPADCANAPHDPNDALDGKYLALVSAVFEPQVNAAANRADYARLQFDLTTRLRSLQGNPALERLDAAIANPEDASLATLVRPNAEALALLEGGTEDATTAARGMSATTNPDQALDTTMDPRAAGDAVARYDKLAKDLTTLRDLLARASTAPEVKAKLQDGDDAAIQALTAPTGDLARSSALAFTLQSVAANLETNLAARAAALEPLADKVVTEVVGTSVVDASSSGNFETFQNWYISADAGFVFAPAVDEVVPYIGVNVYLRPVNKNASLRQLGSFRDTFTRRFAFTLGLTTTSIADGGGSRPATREDLFANQSLLLGAGLRITDMIRLGAGALVFKEEDPNPLVSKFDTSVSYYFTISFDLNVARAFGGGLGGLFK